MKLPSSINVTLGTAFGFVKSFIISSLIFVSVINIYNDGFTLKEKYGPKWLQKSITYRPLSFGAYFILPLVNPILDDIKNNYSYDEKDTSEDKKSEDTKSQIDEKSDLLRRIDDKQKSDETPKTKDGEGYNKDQIEKLDHLIDLI